MTDCQHPTSGSGLAIPSATTLVSPAAPKKPPTGLRSISQARHGPKPTTTTDFTSERATTALIRRVLCSQVPSHGSEQRERGTPRPLEEMLPPLTSSNEVDLQLYALIAITIKEFVYVWYSKITPDHTFTEEIISIIAHCTRALEQRLRQIDIHALVLDEIASLVEAHINAYRIARQSATMIESQSQFRKAYHALNPHPALSPVPEAQIPATVTEQLERESAYRQMLAQGTLAALLPTEELENVCLRTLVGDILADLVLGEIVGGKIVEGWFIWEAISKLAAELEPDPERTPEVEPTGKNRLERFGLLSNPVEEGGHTLPKYQWSIPLFLWTFLQYSYLAYATIRFILMEAAQVASSSSYISVRGPESSTSPKYPAPGGKPWPSSSTVRLPILKYRVFGLVSQIAEVSKRMPWLGGCVALAQQILLRGPGRLGETDGFLDRFLYQTIQKYLFTESLLPSLLLAVRTTVFPANAKPASAEQSLKADIGVSVGSKKSRLEALPLNTVSLPHTSDSPRQSPSVQQCDGANENSIKRACAQSLLRFTPRRVALVLFAIRNDKDFVGTQLSAAKKQDPASRVIPPPGASGVPLGSISPSSDTSSPLSGARKSEIGPRSNTYFEPIQSNPDSAKASPPNWETGNCVSSGAGGKNGNSKAEKVDLSTPRKREGDDEADDEQEELLLRAIEESVLDLFSDSYCNKHLIYSIVELVLVKLVPELKEHCVEELMAERGL